MVNKEGPELMPTGLTTWMEAPPAAPRFKEGTVTEQGLAVHVAPAIVVVDPPNVQVTVDPLVKLLPAMVTERSPWPAVAVDTERLEIVGVERRLDSAWLRLYASTEPSPVA